MKYQKLIKKASVIAVLIFMAACESPPPYVLEVGEFNRDSSTFRTGTTDRSVVTICYAKDGTTPQIVTQMAQDECALYGKKAIFSKQSYQICPLVTPMAAVYDCRENPDAFGTFKPVN